MDPCLILNAYKVINPASVESKKMSNYFYSNGLVYYRILS